MIGPEHQKHFSAALADLLGKPMEGAVAFLRCLPSEQIDALADAEHFAVSGWTVNAVVDTSGHRRVTADQAVERREDKTDAALFLIDTARAGAGLDGIYSAAREIGEAELFKAAQRHARKELRGRLPTVNAALKSAERLGRRRKLTPWQEFDFAVAAAAEGERRALARLGMWPVDGQGALSIAELDLSTAMADRLLFPQDAGTVGERIRALMLDNTLEEVANLERFLRSLAGRRPEEVAAAVADRAELWLGPLKPSFSGEALRKIVLTSWRKPSGGMHSWSGLKLPGECAIKPVLLLDRQAPAKDQAKLTVRWAAEPSSLAGGGVEYRVTVLAGDEELAEQTVAHRDKPQQHAVFSLDDFEEMLGTEKFEALVQVAPVAAQGVEAVRTEEFVLEFGVAGDAETAAGSGQVVRTLVEGAVALKERAAFDKAVFESDRGHEDKKGFIIWKGEGGARAVRVARPILIRRLEEDWAARGGAPGRWVQSVRADGSPAGAIAFVALDGDGCGTEVWRRVCEVSRRLAEDLGPLGLLGRVKATGWRRADEYVNGWLAALESGDPELALHGTVEVRSLGGRTIGLLVTPLHPLRFAWSALYDNATTFARYEDGLEPARLQKTLKAIDSSHFPFALPGIDGGPPFVFADLLGFHAVAMTLDGEPEPKGVVAVLGACLGGGASEVAPSVGTESAAVLAREVRHFLTCHEGATGDRPDLINIQAWRPGDGMTVARALGQVLSADSGEGDEESGATSQLCFTLDLYHPGASSGSGRFLSALGQRRRSGGGVEAGDRWMVETAARSGGVLVPRLRWAKRPEPASNDDESWRGVRATHLGMVFDVFDARLETRPAAELGKARPLHAYGLAKVLERRADLAGEPEWMVWSPPELSGERAPDGHTLGDRLRKVDAAVAKLTARALGGGVESWPVLVTRLSLDGRHRMDRLHERSDWVVTVDRNAGIEYFDAPRSQSEVYERFVIDAVPERADLGSLQLVTSTTNLDAVRDLVDEALGAMGLSGSARNSRFLIGHLKGLSGRLAIRLANAQGRTGELIALALVQANCAEVSAGDGPWLDLTQGFLVPVDEIADFAPIADRAADSEGTNHRADFIHVFAPPKGTLEFRFVEVKHRLHLRSARDVGLLEQMLRQTGELRRRWIDWFFGPKLARLERVTRRSQLARLLRFYADRAFRHRLSEKAHARLLAEIDALVSKEGYEPGDVERPDIGYVFCPEHRLGTVEPIYASGGEHARLHLFGPALLPDGDLQHVSVDRIASTTSSLPDAKNSELLEPVRLPHSARPEPIDAAPGNESDARLPAEAVDVLLGDTAGGEPVEWRVSIKSNPHLMMVGLPGMGKTTALINICRQLAEANVAPIVFSFHDDIDEKLTQVLGPMHTTDFSGLGFNPLRVDGAGPTAYVDVAGTLRDIFASIFPDLGDIQLEEMRQAIKQSYDDNGWARTRVGGERPDPPAFRAFFDILRSKQKPNANLLARLQELADYGFFDAAGDNASLLAERRPTLVRVHTTTNNILQNAFSSFVLYSLYKDMFRRGVQTRLTHAIIFDEAHRVSKLKLIPQFAKECRKYGVALALASQGAKDFSPTLYEAVGSYLTLRVTEADAKALARNAASTADQSRITDRMKSLEPHTALFFSMAAGRPYFVRLSG